MRFFVLLFVFNLASPVIDQSRANPTQTINVDSLAAEQLLKKGKSFLFGQSDSAKIYLNQALNTSDKSQDRSQKANILKYFGIMHAIKSRHDSALYYYNLSAEIYYESNNIEGYADALSNKGLTYSKIARSTEAIEDLHKALDIYDSLGLAVKKSNTLNNLGIVFQLIGDYDKALLNYRISIDTAPENKGNVVRCLMNIATIFNRQEKFDSALVIYQEALVEFTAQENIKGLSVIHNNLGGVYQNLKQYKKAIDHFEKALAYKTKISDKRGQAIVSKNMADILTVLERYQEAKSWAKKSLQLSKEVNSKKQILEALLLSAQIDKQTSDFRSSSSFYEAYNVLKDSLDQAEQTKEIQEIEEKYQTAQRKKEIAELEIENQQSLLGAQENANQRNMLLFALTIILIIVGFLVFLNASKQKSNKLLATALGEKEILLKEIHHRVKNNLQVISSLLNLQAGSLDNEEAREAVREGQNRVKSMALIHEKLYQETDLRGVDIKNYFEHLTAELFNAFGVDRDKVSYQVDTNDLKLDIDTVIPLGLIMNELITNSLKYAFKKSGEGQLKIFVEEQKGTLKVIVSDNGQGIATDAIGTSNSFGWKMIRSLSRKLKAEINIINEEGTRVELTLSRYKLVV